MIRAQFLAAAACALLAGFAAGQHHDAVEFLHLSDTHVIDLRRVAPPLVKAREHFADGERRLANLLSGSGRPDTVSFALITGDLIDGFSYAGSNGETIDGQVDAFRRATSKSPIPLFLTLGNHDVQHYSVAADGVKVAGDQSVAGAARASWTRSQDCFRNGTYYEFTKQAGDTRYVFLMLDNGYNAAGATEKAPVNIGPEQMHWLQRRVLANRDAVIILAVHIIIGSDGVSDAIRKAIDGAPNVAMVLAGHNHRDAIDEIPLGTSTSIQVRTAALGYGTQNWRRIRLLEDRIEVYRTGSKSEIERTIPVAKKAVEKAA